VRVETTSASASSTTSKMVTTATTPPARISLFRKNAFLTEFRLGPPSPKNQVLQSRELIVEMIRAKAQAQHRVHRLRLKSRLLIALNIWLRIVQDLGP